MFLVAHLDRVVEGPEGRVVSAAHCRVLGPHVHFEVLKKVVVLVRAERNHHANRARERGVDKGVVAAWNESRLLQRCDGLAQVEGAEQIDLGRRSVEHSSVPKTLLARRVDVCVVRGARWNTALSKEPESALAACSFRNTRSTSIRLTTTRLPNLSAIATVL